MNKIYFANKLCTVKRKCPNIFPIKDKEFEKTPRDVFNVAGLVVYINPKFNRLLQGFYARISVFAPAEVRYREGYIGSYLAGGCILSAEHRLSVQIESYLKDPARLGETARQKAWKDRLEALRILPEAISLFREYFPE